MLNLYLLKLIPAQYRLLAVAGLLAFVVSGAFGVGWMVNGWRFSGTITDLEHRLSASTLDNKILQNAINNQNDRVEKMERIANQRIKETREAIEKAKRDNQQLQVDIATLRTRTGSTCEDVNALLNEALGL
jgi:hypothetical protein